MLPYELQELIKGHKDLNKYVREDLKKNIESLMEEIDLIKIRINQIVQPKEK